MVQGLEPGNLARPGPEIRSRLELVGLLPEHRVDFLENVIHVAWTHQQTADKRPQPRLIPGNFPHNEIVNVTGHKDAPPEG
jgi:hypothetical protein